MPLTKIKFAPGVKKEGGKLDYLPDAYRDGGRIKII